MRILILSLVLLLFPYAGAERVCSVHDGDTFRTCSGQSVRLYGVDAPELRQPKGKSSRDYLRRLVTGRAIILKCVGTSYARQVCRVSAGGVDVSREMAGHGWAFDSPKYSHGEFSAAEAFARKQGRGVWALSGGGVRPWDWRHRY